MQVTTGTTSLTPRWDKCVNYVENTLIYAVGRLFIEWHFQEDKKLMVRYLAQFQAIAGSCNPSPVIEDTKQQGVKISLGLESHGKRDSVGVDVCVS